MRKLYRDGSCLLTFVDVNFTTLRPFGSGHSPKCWPDAANGIRHVLYIQNYDRVPVRAIRRDTVTVSSPCCGRDDALEVRTHDELVTGGYAQDRTSQPPLLGIGSVKQYAPYVMFFRRAVAWST